MIIKTLKMLVVLAVFAASPLLAQDTFFSYDFDFGGVDELGFPIETMAELNAEGDLTGEWSGDDFPFAGDDLSSYFANLDGGSCTEECFSSGIVQSPFDDNESLLFIDRPREAATHYMNLTETIDLPGAEFSVTVGTRRTGGGTNEPKSYDFFGLDSDGNESFRIKILADGSTERLGYVTDGGNTVVKDLPTVEGEDMADDIANTGGPPFGVNDDIVVLNVRLGASGYTVAYENLNGTNSYVTNTLPFNGDGTNLAQIGLSYSGVATATGSQVGFVVDDVLVTGFEDLLLGDFNFDGDVDLDDFMTLANNYGTFSTDGDFDFNGKVDLADWAGFFDAYQAANAAPAASVPEPAGVALLGMGVIFGLLSRRRRQS